MVSVPRSLYFQPRSTLGLGQSIMQRRLGLQVPRRIPPKNMFGWSALVSAMSIYCTGSGDRHRSNYVHLHTALKKA
jgi:hypothetical protein